MKNTIKISKFVLSLIDLFDESECRKILIDLVRGPHCRFCKKPISEKHVKRFYEGKQVSCKICKSKFIPVAGTILSQSKLSYRQILLILTMLSLGFKTKNIASAVGVAPHTVPRWRRKLKQWIKEND